MPSMAAQSKPVNHFCDLTFWMPRAAQVQNIKYVTDKQEELSHILTVTTVILDIYYDIEQTPFFP